MKARSGWVTITTLDLPSLKNNTGDTDRLIEALKAELKTAALQFDFDLLQSLPTLLRKHAYRVRCVLFKDLERYHLVAVLDPDDSESIFGLAMDIGTTTVAMALVDLMTGEKIGENAFSNPQATIGPDILTRIHYAESKEGLDILNRLLVDAINENIDRLCGDNLTRKERIFIASAAGNTAMTHLFLGLPPGHLIREPYIPVINRIPLIKALRLGIRIHPEGWLYLFPNIGSYFGGDLFAGILYSGLHERDSLSLLVDVGTNAEVVIGNREWFMACAGAAGPALEGGVTRMGMPAGPGVIDRVFIDPDTHEMRVQTIGNLAPKGICGSGLIDLAAALFRAGMIDIRGKWIPPACVGRMKRMESEDHFVLVPAQETADGIDLTLTQADLDSLIRSKAAMYTILETLTHTVGVKMEEISRFYIAGVFGSVIDPESAVTIGMIPDMPRERFYVLGNSAIGGAAQVLISREKVDEVSRIRDRTAYLELNVNADFMNRFSAARFLPHTDLSRFPSVTSRSAGRFSFKADPESQS